MLNTLMTSLNNDLSLHRLPITNLSLPIPPSVNRAFTKRKGSNHRIRTKEYDDWKMYAGAQINIQKPEPVKGRCLIVVNVERQSANADIDNRMKPLFDLLVAHQIIEDDRFITGFATAWSPKRDGLCHLLIFPVSSTKLEFHPTEDCSATGGWYLAQTQERERTNCGL